MFRVGSVQIRMFLQSLTELKSNPIDTKKKKSDMFWTVSSMTLEMRKAESLRFTIMVVVSLRIRLSCNEVISSKSKEVLGRAPKCYLNIKPSKRDVFSSMQTIARKVNPDERDYHFVSPGRSIE